MRTCAPLAPLKDPGVKFEDGEICCISEMCLLADGGVIYYAVRCRIKQDKMCRAAFNPDNEQTGTEDPSKCQRWAIRQLSLPRVHGHSSPSWCTLVQFDFLEAVVAEHTQHGRIGEVVVCITSDLGKSNLVFNVIAPVTVSSISLQVYLPFRL